MDLDGAKSCGTVRNRVEWFRIMQIRASWCFVVLRGASWCFMVLRVASRKSVIFFREIPRKSVIFFDICMFIVEEYGYYRRRKPVYLHASRLKKIIGFSRMAEFFKEL